MIVIMMIIITIMMAAIMIAVDQYAAAQEADHHYSKDKEQNAFHHEIGGVFMLSMLPRCECSGLSEIGRVIRCGSV
jgi:hypothetical protein